VGGAVEYQWLRSIVMKLSERLPSHLDFFILIGITALFIPFFSLSSTIDPVLIPRFCIWGIMSFILFTSLVIQLFRTTNSIDCSVLRRLIFPAFLCYFLFSLISLIKAINITEGIYEVLKIFLCIVYLFIATLILSKNKSYIPILVKVVIATATILSAIGIYQYLRYDSSGYSATMANKNQLSSALFLMLPFCLYAVLAFCDYWRVISTVPTGLILLNIFLLQTRSVWVAIFVSTVATMIVVTVLFRKLNVLKETKAKFLKGFLYITIVLIVVFLTSGYFYLKSNPIDSPIKRIQSTYSAKYESNIERILMWKKTLKLAQDNLILGIGAGNWKIALPSYGLDELTERSFKKAHFQRPHNDYIWVLSETGIFGFIFYLSVFGMIIFYVLRIIIQHSNTDDKLLSIFMFFGIAGYMVISCFSFPKERIFHSMFLLLMMAVITSIYHQTFVSKSNVSHPFILTMVIPSLLILFFVIINGYIRLNAEVHTRRALAARKAGNWPMVISEIDKGYSAFATLDPMSTPLKWYRGEANFLLNNVSEALEDFKKAYKAHPYHIHVLNNLATCYELKGDHNQAIYYYKKALEIFPQFEDALINLGATYCNNGRYQEAYKTLLQCDQNMQNPKLERYLKAVKEKLDRDNRR
jgi:O-antigen ligase